MITPYFSDDTVTLYTGDAAEVLRELPANTADCVVTSPPYWGLRDYGTGRWTGGDPACTHSTGRGTGTPPPRSQGTPHPASPAHRGGGPRTCLRCGAVRHDRQYGLELTPEEYVEALRGVFAELRRVLSSTGTVWLNLGDSYSATPPGRTDAPMRRSTAMGRRALGIARESVQRAGVDRTRALPRKNMIGMPWRVAFALQADGWILRNAVVWHKPNAMPESVNDRMSNRYELIFLLVRQPRYFFDLDAIREPPAQPPVTENIDPSGSRTGRPAGTERQRGRNVSGTGKYTADAAFSAHPPGASLRPTGRRHTAAHAKGKNPGDVWSITTRPLRAAHFAAFPVDLPLRCIAAGCPPGGTVLDPFSGAATTAIAAAHLKREYIGIDLSTDFHDIALDRLGLPRPGTTPPQDGRAA
ncbi:DNA-methyltransferase [Streptomyces sp. NPDC059629]|uniref:DNA-methyltransferase n=1 Tax=Streptomyces sp. NPDC059629 TaxID=3346889 RepID=UPI0036A0EDBB